MPFIEVSQGGPNIPDGVYPVILSAISDPKTVTAQRGPKAGQDIQLIDWTFVILDGQYKDIELVESTSTASGPRSKMYAWLTALFGGVAPAVGTKFEKSDLTGRVALATIRKDDTGWPRIENLGAMPAQMLQQQFVQQTGTPVAAPAPAPVPAPQPVPAAPAPAVTVGQPAAATGQDVPF